ncbi:hypothetical protein DPMN_101714 [Dreissena polymorpha]|uniref:Uncharacterized protein n=1 Tax=Dreissena polymorpha TaxID=45954 RepID=A0A9D4LJZ9_DREPO|nr:hypothetical protein DPMN_101714 [Dreissena polymorpha]
MRFALMAVIESTSKRKGADMSCLFETNRVSSTVQVYAPDSSKSFAFHWSQLPKVNDFFSCQPPAEFPIENEIDASKYAKLYRISGRRLDMEYSNNQLQLPATRKNDMPQAIEQPSMDSSAELSTETVSHHLQPLDRPLAQRDSDMASDNENDLPQAIEQPSMDSSAKLLTETVGHHFQPPDRPSGQRDYDMKSANGMFISNQWTSAELSTETISHHLQTPDRLSAKRDSDMESENENDLPQAIEQPSMDSSAELLTETVCHHFQPPDRPSGRRDSDMKSANENDLTPGIDQQSMD